MEDIVSRGRNCLLMKLLSNGYHNREALKSTMKKAWRPTKAIRFYDMSMGLMLVEFDNLIDKLRVIRDGPWHFDKVLLLTKYFTGEQHVKNIHLNEVAF